MFNRTTPMPRHRVTLVNPGFFLRLLANSMPSMLLYGPYRDGVYYLRRADGGYIKSPYWLSKHTDTPAATARGTVRRASVVALRPGTQPDDLPSTMGDRHAA